MGQKHREIHAYMEGPAARLWVKAFGTGVRLSTNLSEVVGRSRMLLTGTGWQSDLEHDARKLAKSAELRSAAVVDHWTNYRERFIRQGEEVLPDEIWVADEYAKNLAEREFSDLKILQLPNSYLDNQVQEVREQEVFFEKHDGCNFLYVLEPILKTWGKHAQAGEFQALNFFIENLNLLQAGVNPSILLRPHPSDPVGKYDQWINSQRNLRIYLDESPSLARSIAWSDVVVGCQTYAMVVALAAGRRVVSSIPPWAPPCSLPQAGIDRLADFVRAKL